MFDVKMITPFSNALSYIAWEQRNCCRCTRSCYETIEPEYDEDGYPEYYTSDCAIQLALWDWQILGTITADIAKRAGLPGGTRCGEFEPVVEEA